MLIVHTASGDGYDGVAGAEVTVLIQDDDPIPVQPGDQGGGTAEDQGWFDPPGFGRWWPWLGGSPWHWARGDLERAVALGVLSYDDALSFVPGAPVTRAEFTAMVVRAVGLVGAREVPCRDVSPSHPFYRELRRAAAGGLLDCGPSGLFRPDEAVTREEAATVAARVLVLSGQKEVPSELVASQMLARFKDSGDISWSRLCDVALAVYREVLRGRDGDHLAPREPLTQAEAVTIAIRLWRWVSRR